MIQTHLLKTTKCMHKDNLASVLYPEVCTNVRQNQLLLRVCLPVQATVAAFAASEGHAHPRVVELPKTEEGLGFNVMGGKEQSSPIYISRIIPGGVADRLNCLKRGDQLLSVNGVVSCLLLCCVMWQGNEWVG